MSETRNPAYGVDMGSTPRGLARGESARARREFRSVPLLSHPSVFAMVTGGDPGGIAAAARGDDEETARFAMAARFVGDAAAGRQITLRAGPEAAARLERLLGSLWYRAWLLAWVALHMALTFAEPPPVAVDAGVAPPAWVGALEAVAIAVEAADAAAHASAFGRSHFRDKVRPRAHRYAFAYAVICTSECPRDKVWDAVFVVIAALCALDWLVVYVGGVWGFFRFSRPLRPFLMLAKLPDMRRLFATMLKTVRADICMCTSISELALQCEWRAYTARLPQVPKMLDIGTVFVAFMVMYAVLGVQLFSVSGGGGQLWLCARCTKRAPPRVMCMCMWVCVRVCECV